MCIRDRAYETGAAVTVVLTKADLAESDAEVASVRDRVRALAGPDVQTVVVSADDPSSVEAVRALVPPNTTAVLIGKSGVGKSSLINMLVGHELQATPPVRDRDGKGRHTTASRETVAITGGGFIMDMPGVRGRGPVSYTHLDVYKRQAWCQEDMDVWDVNAPARALENTAFVAAVNRYGVEDQLVMPGHTKVCNPRGHVVAELAEEAEGVLHVELDLNEVVDYRPVSYTHLEVYKIQCVHRQQFRRAGQRGQRAVAI